MASMQVLACFGLFEILGRNRILIDIIQSDKDFLYLIFVFVSLKTQA
jgi:hypothetical protein